MEPEYTPEDMRRMYEALGMDPDNPMYQPPKPRGVAPLNPKLDTVVNFSKQGLTEIPDLSRYIYLQKLYLSYNKIQQIQGLNNLPNLQVLSLDNNQINQIQGLDNLPNLQELYLYDNQIQQIQGLDNLPNLQVLYLWGNQIQQIQGLDNLPNLQILGLDCNQISKNDPEIAKLRQRGVTVHT